MTHVLLLQQVSWSSSSPSWLARALAGPAAAAARRSCRLQQHLLQLLHSQSLGTLQPMDGGASATSATASACSVIAGEVPEATIEPAMLRASRPLHKKASVSRSAARSSCLCIAPQTEVISQPSVQLLPWPQLWSSDGALIVSSNAKHLYAHKHCGI